MAEASARSPKWAMRKAERIRLGKMLARALAATPGAERVEPWVGCVEWQVPTRVGRLTVHYDAEYGGIMTRFAEPGRATRVVDCNPYTGKWNHHHDRADTAETAAGAFLARLGRLLPEGRGGPPA